MVSNFYLVAEQPRNHHLVTAINRYLDDRNEGALVAFFRDKSPGEQIMMVGYLLSADLPGMARDLMLGTEISLVTALSTLDRKNGSELARNLQWDQPPPVIRVPASRLPEDRVIQPDRSR